MHSTPEEDWKTDWLYKLVFQHFENAWLDVKDDRFLGAIPPEEFLITQFDEMDDDGGIRRGKPIRFWQYIGDDFIEVQERDNYRESNPVRYPRYKYATGRFAISPDRKTVYIDYVFGPLYGRGYTFLVQGEGDKAKLVPKPGGFHWLS
jgi:hypothetical protein